MACTLTRTGANAFSRVLRECAVVLILVVSSLRCVRVFTVPIHFYAPLWFDAFALPSKIQNGSRMNLSGDYWSRRNRALALALDWKVTSNSKLANPSNWCDTRLVPSCGRGGGEPSCGAIDRRRLQGDDLGDGNGVIDPDCARTCDDIEGEGPAYETLRDQCEKGTSLTYCMITLSNNAPQLLTCGFAQCFQMLR